MKRLIITLFLISITSIFAQEFNKEDFNSYYIELLRSDVKFQKKFLVSQTMQFSEEDASVFWPIYEEYESELDKLGDKRLANIKDFAENFKKMSDLKADKIIEQAFNYQEERISLKRNIYNRIKEKLNASTAAKFIQIEHQIQLIVDLKIIAELPLLKKTSNESEPK
ncbi:hypothetical protein ACFLSH_01885 [Bacteroidota bacterium]